MFKDFYWEKLAETIAFRVEILYLSRWIYFCVNLLIGKELPTLKNMLNTVFDFENVPTDGHSASMIDAK